MTDYDVGILGAGPGGYVAALRAARLGLKTALIEAASVGGVCLNKGCIPTKAIVASVNKYRGAIEAAPFGIELKDVTFNINTIIARKNNIVSNLAKGIHQLLKGSKVDLYTGHGRLKGNREISVNDHLLKANNIIIATGSSWRELPHAKFDGKLICSSDELLDLETLPESVCIVGGGVVGCEFASILATLGTNVTIIEAMDSILPMEDANISRTILRTFKKQGIRVFTGTMLNAVEKGAGYVEVETSDGKQIKASLVMIAIGRKPNISDIGIEDLGIKTEKGAIVTDGKMRTNIGNIYAVGDVNGKYMLAHVASQEGIVAVENIAGKDRLMDYSAVPRPLFTHPEACGVGATESDLTGANIDFSVGKFNYLSLGKAQCDGLREGQVTVYADKSSHVILGAAIVGEHASEIAPEITLAVRKKLRLEDVADTIHSHPTISEVIQEAAEDCVGGAIHKIYK